MSKIMLTAFCLCAQLAVAAAPSAPALSISVNESDGGAVYRGWTIVIDAILSHPNLRQNDSSTFLLSPQSGNWADGLRVQALNQNGVDQNWTFETAGSPDVNAVTLDSNSIIQAQWLVSPDDTGKLTPGVYQIVASLKIDASADPNGWTGTVTSRPVTIQVADEPPSPSSDQQTRKQVLLATFKDFAGDHDGALAVVNAVLGNDPHNVQLLSLKSGLLAESGDFFNAFTAVSDAVAAVYTQNPQPPEPPGDLILQQHDMLTHLLSGVTSVAPTRCPSGPSQK